MLWLRVFWLEAFLVPVFCLWQLAQQPAGAPYRTVNLVLWSAAWVAAVLGLVASRLRRRPTQGGGALNGGGEPHHERASSS